MLPEIADELEREGGGFVMARDVGQVRDAPRADEDSLLWMATTIPDESRWCRAH